MKKIFDSLFKSTSFTTGNSQSNEAEEHAPRIEPAPLTISQSSGIGTQTSHQLHQRNDRSEPNTPQPEMPATSLQIKEFDDIFSDPVWNTFPPTVHPAEKKSSPSPIESELPLNLSFAEQMQIAQALSAQDAIDEKVILSSQLRRKKTTPNLSEASLRNQFRHEESSSKREVNNAQAFNPQALTPGRHLPRINSDKRELRSSSCPFQVVDTQVGMNCLKHAVNNMFQRKNAWPANVSIPDAGALIELLEDPKVNIGQQTFNTIRLEPHELDALAKIIQAGTPSGMVIFKGDPNAGFQETSNHAHASLPSNPTMHFVALKWDPSNREGESAIWEIDSLLSNLPRRFNSLADYAKQEVFAGQGLSCGVLTNESKILRRGLELTKSEPLQQICSVINEMFSKQIHSTDLLPNTERNQRNQDELDQTLNNIIGHVTINRATIESLIKNVHGRKGKQIVSYDIDLSEKERQTSTKPAADQIIEWLEKSCSNGSKTNFAFYNGYQPIVVAAHLDRTKPKDDENRWTISLPVSIEHKLEENIQLISRLSNYSSLSPDQKLELQKAETEAPLLENLINNPSLKNFINVQRNRIQNRNQEVEDKFDAEVNQGKTANLYDKKIELEQLEISSNFFSAIFRDNRK